MPASGPFRQKVPVPFSCGGTCKSGTAKQRGTSDCSRRIRGDSAAGQCLARRDRALGGQCDRAGRLRGLPLLCPRFNARFHPPALLSLHDPLRIRVPGRGAVVGPQARLLGRGGCQRAGRCADVRQQAPRGRRRLVEGDPDHCRHGAGVGRLFGERALLRGLVLGATEFRRDQHLHLGGLGRLDVPLGQARVAGRLTPCCGGC